MIVSVCLPMLGALDAPAELDRAGERSETIANCQGNDACRGTDAGNTFATHHNLTDDFSWTGDETITYYGEMNASVYSSTGTTNNDGYILDLPVGYGFTAELSWNHTGSGWNDDNAFLLALGPGDGGMTSYYVGDWGYHYNSATGGPITMGTDGTMDGGLYGGWYDADPPIDLVGDSAVIWIWCYQCYNAGITQEYTLNISVWTGDGLSLIHI